MSESAENVRKVFDAIQRELLVDLGIANSDQPATDWGWLAASRYVVAALREIAVQVARIGDLIERH